MQLETPAFKISVCINKNREGNKMLLSMIGYYDA